MVRYETWTMKLPLHFYYEATEALRRSYREAEDEA